MKTLTAPAAAITQRTAADLRFLLQLDFTVPAALTLRLSDQPLTAAGQDWLPLVLDWGTISASMDLLDLGGRPTTATLTLHNARSVEGTSATRLSDLIYGTRNTSGYQWAFAKATIYALLDPSHGASDAITVGVFYLEDPQEISDAELTVTMSDLAQVFENKLKITTVTRDLFSLCPDDSIGQAIRVPFGTLKHVKTVPVIDSIAGVLAADITDTATTLTLVDNSRFPLSGTVQIDTEHLAYTGKSGNDLTGLTRHQNSTTAAAHNQGVSVYQVRTGSQAYRYAVGENVGNYKIRSVTNVMINGAPPSSAASPTVVLDETALVAGKSFATIDLDRLAKFFTPQASTATRTVAVTTISITMNGGTGSPTSPQTRTVSPSTSGGTTATDRKLTARVFRSGNLTGTVNSWTLSRRISGGSDVVAASGSFQNAVGGTQNISHTAHYESTADEILTFAFIINNTNDGALALYFDQYQVTDYGTIQAGGGPSSADVTCDVEGLEDDGSGTISGSPAALLEVPADVAKVIHLNLLPGLTSSDLGTTWPGTRDLQVGYSYKWGVLLGPTPYSRLRQLISDQSRSALYISGSKVEYRFLSESPAVDRTIDYQTEINQNQPAIVRRTPRTSLATSLTVQSQYDDVAGSYKRVILQEDLTQPGLNDRLSDTLELPWVQDADTATALGTYWLGIRKRTRFELELAADHRLAALEVSDHVNIDNHPILTVQGPILFRVIGRDDARDGSMTLHAVEAAFPPPTFAATGFFMAYGSRGNASQRHASNVTQWVLTANLVYLRDATISTIVVRDNPSNITIDTGTAGPVANGRDQSGAFTVSTFVHFYWIWNGSTLAGIASATAPPTGPVLPTGYTHWAYEGSGLLDGSGNLIMMYHRGDRAFYQAANAVLSTGASSTEVTVSCSAFVPANAREYHLLGTWSAVGNSAADMTAAYTLRLITTINYYVATNRMVGLSASHTYGHAIQTVILPNVSQAFIYLWSTLSSGVSSPALTLNVIGYTMPNGSS